jgi:hypothetical protein
MRLLSAAAVTPLLFNVPRQQLFLLPREATVAT